MKTDKENLSSKETFTKEHRLIIKRCLDRFERKKGFMEMDNKKMLFLFDAYQIMKEINKEARADQRQKDVKEFVEIMKKHKERYVIGHPSLWSVVNELQIEVEKLKEGLEK